MTSKESLSSKSDHIRNQRKLLLDDLEGYPEAWPQDDRSLWARYREFVSNTPDCCQRWNQAGHCTGSAFVSCPQGEKVLLLYHPFLQRWLQPGGHADGDPDLLAVALREAHEETGLPLQRLRPYRGNGVRVPFDLDIHAIPARKNEPDHWHYDLRYLVIASPQDPLVPETPDLRLAWLSLDEVAERTDEESVLRLVRKLRGLPRDGCGALTGVDGPTANDQ
jgi:8-oxo-dGTP pyrophosphatase MutT (NUDIX family)